MKRGQRKLIFVLSSLAFCAGADAISADTPSNPYQGIVDRNVFGLKPPPPLPKPEDNKPPPAKITLTGITTILGNKRALMKVQVPAKPGEPAKEQSYILTEGQRDGEIEVLEINEQEGSVKVNESGLVTLLTFDKDGAKLPSTPPPAVSPAGAPPAAMAPANANAPFTGSSPVTSIGGAPNTGLKAIPTRTLRLPTAGGVGSPNSGAVQPQVTPQLSPEEQMIMIEVERERTKGSVANGLLPPLPPTPLTPKGSAGTTPQGPSPAVPR